MRLPLFCSLAIAATFTITAHSALAQGTPLPSGTSIPVPQSPSARSAALPTTTPPSLQNKNLQRSTNSGAAVGQITDGGKLPRTAGQEHRVYDLRPYTGYLTQYDHPEQAIVDWVLRETGSDVWFTEPFGFMNANRDSLSVYHTNEMHQAVAGVVDRFVAGEKDPLALRMLVMTVGNPNWRSSAHMLMQHVAVESSGVQAWLLSKENAAIVLNQLRQRTDTRQIQDLNLVTYNGQSEKLNSIRGRNYVRNVRQALAGWPPYEPETSEVREGYRLSISPLLSTDGKSVDCVIKAGIDQVDKLFPVDLELPLPNNQVHRARIDVPQVASCRFHERFRWPSDTILLLSCGVVASPERPQSAVPLLNMDVFTGTTAGKADALMFIHYRGRASETLTTPRPASAAAPQVANQPDAPNRGRY